MLEVITVDDVGGGEAGYAPPSIHVRSTGRGRPRLAKGEGPSPTVNSRLVDELGLPRF